MAKWIKWSEEQQKEWMDWKLSLPKKIQTLLIKHNLSGDILYRLNPTGIRVILLSVNAKGKLQLGVCRDFNYLAITRRQKVVLNDVDPNDVFECDYPPADEVFPGDWHPVLDGNKGQSIKDLGKQQKKS